MFGDSAIMVHPDDERYQQFIGKKVYIPGTDRQITVISDEYVEIGFGTGVVKVTPAHDPNDFEVGNRHNLERIICMNEDGTMNEYAGIYQGMDRFECRKQLVKDLTEKGLCPKIEKMVHSVGHSERTGVVVEPRLSKQWFVKMDTLAKDVVEMQKGKDAIKFIPNRFNKRLISWFDVDDVQDWCISRQLWWGHRIPAWYKDEEIYVGRTAPEGEGWTQDEDVLDTWFSSALWPFATLGWPEQTADLERYYPTDCLVTGYDIITFWVARMAVQGKHFMGQRPFKECFIHGLIRDEQGRKMSKSLGNGVDPFDLIDQYGCDAMRYFLTTNATPGQDLRYSDEKMASSWNYINKIWNVSRFIQLSLTNENYQDEAINTKKCNTIDKWILNRMNQVITKVNKNYDKYELGEVARVIYNFTWDDFASWYLEMTKVVFSNGTKEEKINTCAVLKEVLTNILKLLHPFMPFVTEEIYQHFYPSSIMISDWPKASRKYNFKDVDTNVITLYNIITAVRNIRNEKNVPMSKKIEVRLEVASEELLAFLQAHENYLSRFINFETLKLSLYTDESNEDSTVTLLENVKVIIPLNNLINVEEELARLTQLENKLVAEVERSTKMLSNPNFISKAPEAKVKEEQNKLQKYQDQLAEVRKQKERLLNNAK